MNDPFANAPENDLPVDVPNDPTEDATSAFEDVEGIQSVVVTYKGDGGAPWIVVHADSVQAQIDAMNSAPFKALLTRSQNVAEFFAKLYKGPARGGSQNASQARPQAQGNALPPGTPVVTCNHGQRVYKSGNNARGPWAALMCPSTDRQNQCAPMWKQKDGTFK